MKYILTLIIVISSLFGISQNKIEYPRYEKDSLGNLVVVITLEQAQKIDSDMELLNLLIKSNIQVDTLEAKYIKIVQNLNNTIYLQTIEISTLKEKGKIKDDQIKILQQEISQWKEVNLKCEQQKENNNESIKLLKKEVKRQKRQKIIVFVGSIAVLIGSTYLLITK